MKDFIRRMRFGVWHQVKKWGFFEYTLLAIVTVIVVSGAILYIQSFKKEYVTITVRIANRERQYEFGGAPSPLSSQLYAIGTKSQDAFGRTTEITDVESFPNPQVTTYGAKETVYVSVKTMASYNARAGTYTVKGENVNLGDWIRIEIGPVLVQGTVYDIEGKFQKTKEEILTVKAQLKREWGGVFPNTTGVDPYIADAIRTGDTMTDSRGKVFAKVLNKTVQAARTVTVDANGNLWTRPNPRRVDVFLTLELRVKRLKGQAYFLDEQPVKVDSTVPLFLPAVSIEPTITEIISSVAQ